ncbi:uncharacterized protein A1O9_04414, partial [Exophiala aquamarina CBS 119918]
NHQIATLLFLEPPHSHDPTAIADFISLPTAMLNQLPAAAQDLLWTVQEATSIVFASYQRLQELLERSEDNVLESEALDTRQRYPNAISFNYRNYLQAERDYLLIDAMPDWRHKAVRLTIALKDHSSLRFQWSGQHMTVGGWWKSIQRTVASWAEQAEEIVIPEPQAIQEELQLKFSRPSTKT